MHAKEFFSVILPPEGNGYYCAVELTTSRKQHTFCDNLAGLFSAAAKFSDDGKDTYFGLATYAAPTNRTATNSAKIRCLFADIDVRAEQEGLSKHSAYGSIEAALAGLQSWLSVTGFPQPYVVASGGGLHCYWPFEESVDVLEWKPLAESFKRACAQHGFLIDPTVSSDAARVLRVPGTRNTKYRSTSDAATEGSTTSSNGVGKLVHVLSEGEAYPVEYYARLLEQYQKQEKPLATGVAPSFDILDQAPVYARTEKPAFNTELAEVSQSNWEKIEALGEDGCRQIAFYIKNAKNDGMEPLWRSVISIAKFCVNGEEHARRLSALHPYEESRFIRKFASIPGPHGCATLDGANPGVCGGCKFSGKISSPIVLGREIKQGAAPPTLADSDQHHSKDGSTQHQQEVDTPTPPKGFIFSKSGVAGEFEVGNGVKRVIFVCDTVVYATTTYDRAGERYVQFVYIEHGEKKSTVMPLATATAKDESIKAFAKIGIIVPNSAENQFRAYIKATLAQAKLHAPTIMPTNLGWQADDSFAFDGRVFTKHGEFEVPMYGFENINETMGVAGTLDGWRLVMAGVMKLERWDIVSMMLISFAAPLMRFTGLNGVTFHLCGNGSGRGKTLSQRLASSVWGVPDKFRTTPNTSPLAMVNRLGMLGNLPLMVDEITHKGRAEGEWFPEFLSQMSDGRGKDRMESQTNAERRNTTTWASIALMTSNKHMVDYLTAERAHGSEGEIRRLIEIVFTREMNIDELTKSLLFDTLPENYGVAGEAYARWLVRNVEVAKTITKETYTEVFRNFNATGDERFWIAGCACILAAVRLIGPQGAGILTVPFGKIARFLFSAVTHMREETNNTRRSAMDVLNEFTKRNFGKLVFVNGAIAKIAGIEVAETLDRKDLCGRVEKHAATGIIDYFIEERELKAFCSAMSYGYAEFKQDMQETFARDKKGTISYLRKNLLAGTKGPAMSVRVIHIQQKADSAEQLNMIGEPAKPAYEEN